MTPRMWFRLTLKILGVVLALAGLWGVFRFLGMIVMDVGEIRTAASWARDRALETMVTLGIVSSMVVLGAGIALLLRPDWLVNVAYPIHPWYCQICGRRTGGPRRKECPECAQGSRGNDLVENRP